MATVVRKDVWMMARDLAAALAETPEVAAFRQAEDALLSDPEAKALVDEYERKKRAVKFSKNQPREQQEPLIYAFMEIEDRFNAHPLVQAYADAREQIDMLMERINLVLTYPLTGQEAPPRKVGCGGGSGGGCGCGS